MLNSFVGVLIPKHGMWWLMICVMDIELDDFGFLCMLVVQVIKCWP